MFFAPHPHLLPLADAPTIGTWIFLVAAVALALSFEFVNGFHDTANAVATVIYTHTLRPWIAVVWSGLWNLAGVLTSSGTVAFTVLALLPVELVINVGSGPGFAMIFALLISAILWNLGTWYLGLPASSSHTLIGSIMGVGIANAVMSHRHAFTEGVNWHKAEEVFLSLLVSPIVGFVGAGLLLLLGKLIIKKPELFQPPPKDQPPPVWIRGLLMLTCTGVSFAHGSNDGQKGMGLLLLILIGVLPAQYALNLHSKSEDVRKLETTARQIEPMLQAHVAAAGVPTSEDHDFKEVLSMYLKSDGKLTAQTYAAVATANRGVIDALSGKSSVSDVPAERRTSLRTDLYLVDQTLDKLARTKQIQNANELTIIKDYHKQLDSATKFLPLWVKVSVALALGLGTMIGWKRIVVTVGEKIGKEHLNYAQGASAELIAMTTIGLADRFGLPVSTTHVLSSGVAGTMAANRSGLQMATLRNVMMAWVLTLPVCVLLGAAMFAAGLFIVFRHLVVPVGVAAGILAAILIGRRLWIAMSHPPTSPITAGAAH